MAECARCGKNLEASSSYGFHMQPIGTADQLMAVLDLMGSGLDEGKFLAEGWDMCISCVALQALESLSPDERARVIEISGSTDG